MWQDMGDVPPALFKSLRVKSEAQLKEMLSRGEYAGWLASPAASPENVVAGAGVHLRRVMAHPLKNSRGTVHIAEGQHGVLVNVFTEPEWRRRGLATLLMRRIIGWSREQRLDRLTLHASDAGRALYERMGFVATNEMRLFTE